MAHRLIFNPLIPGDLVDALDYYENITPELANRFRVNVDQRLDEIASRAESFPIDVSPIRFAKIDRFPYLIFFIAKTDFVSVIAIVHGSSEPSRWRDREE